VSPTFSRVDRLAVREWEVGGFSFRLFAPLRSKMKGSDFTGISSILLNWRGYSSGSCELRQRLSLQIKSVWVWHEKHGKKQKNWGRERVKNERNIGIWKAVEEKVLFSLCSVRQCLFSPLFLPSNGTSSCILKFSFCSRYAYLPYKTKRCILIPVLVPVACCIKWLYMA
jgi:hypothetical protein